MVMAHPSARALSRYGDQDEARVTFIRYPRVREQISKEIGKTTRVAGSAIPGILLIEGCAERFTSAIHNISVPILFVERESD